MRSHWKAGQVKLRGKLEKVLICGCCAVKDLRPKFLELFWRTEAQKQADQALKSRMMSRRPYIDANGDTQWPDSDWIYEDRSPHGAQQP